VVHAHHDKSTMLSWKYTNMSLNGEPLTDLPLELSVASDGAVELVNVEELQRNVLQEAGMKGKARRALDFGGDELAKLAANKQALATFYLRDAVMFFYPQGVTVRRNRAVEYDDEIQGVGDDTLKAVNRWTVLPERDLPAGTMAIEWTQDVDRHDVERYFSALGKTLGMKVDASRGLLEKKGLFALDRITYWPHVMIASTKVSTQSGFEQFDSIEMRSSRLDPNWKH
jgi:hypothetical protein